MKANMNFQRSRLMIMNKGKNSLKTTRRRSNKDMLEYFFQRGLNQQPVMGSLYFNLNKNIDKSVKFSYFKHISLSIERHFKKLIFTKFDTFL